MTSMTFIGPSFRLDVPTDWFAFSSPQYQTMFLSPPTTDGLRANLTITIQPRENNVTPQQYAELLHEAYLQSGRIRDISEQNTISLGEIAAFRTIATIYSGDEETGEAQPGIFQQEVIAVVDDMIYIVLAARPANVDEALQAMLDDIFAMMFETFQFKQATLTA